MKNNQAINWVPEHIRDGRFGMWLENVRDWAISRDRFWGTPLPIWQSEDGDTICVGSKEELEELVGEKVDDLHKHIIDKLIIVIQGKEYKRIPEVLDCWFESGAMPYASFHYPFENKEKFEKNFPAEFISEGQDQTRGWFYTLHVLATALTTGKNPAINVGESTSSFKNVIVNGVVLAEDGKKMSKRLQNYPDPMSVVEKYGVDSLRLYLMSSSILKGENLNFNEKEVSDLRRKVFVIWFNILKFFEGFSCKFDVTKKETAPEHIMDRWLLSKLHSIIGEVTNQLDSYDLVRASRVLINSINVLSTWYLRLSRDRLRDTNNQEAGQVFGRTIYTLAQLFAPFAPFFSDFIHQRMVGDGSSIHLSDWPKVDLKLVDSQLELEMETVQKVVEMAHALRKDEGVKLRQPLSLISISLEKQLVNKADLEEVVRGELNVKQVEWLAGAEQLSVKFDFVLSPDLILEGEARELVRKIQNLRRKQGLSPDQLVTVEAPSIPEGWTDYVQDKTNSTLKKGKELKLIFDN